MPILERVHLLLLSLAIRGAGVYFLVTAATALDGCMSYVFFPTSSPNAALYEQVYAGYFAVKLGLAIYFLLGAPPALRWVQRFPRDRTPDPTSPVNLPPIPTDKGMTHEQPGDKLS